MDVEFTDAEIREELARLGYRDVPDEKLREFKKDLMRLIHTERSKSNSLNSSTSELRHDEVHPQAIKTGPDYTRDNVSNHGSQWLRSNYKEDWNYQGAGRAATSTKAMEDNLSRPKSAATYRGYDTQYGSTYRSPYAQEVNNSNFPDDESDAGSDKRSVKRKTARKSESGCSVIDESFSHNYNETAGIYEIYEKIKSLAMRDCECGKSRVTSSDIKAALNRYKPPYRICGFNKRPSVIFKGEPPHTRNLVRTDPTKRHKMYEKMWKTQPAIGDDTHEALRKQVHQKMLQKYEVRLPQKVFVPNPYVIPTDKGRYELRWAVRRANENYEMPPHGFYHEV